MTTIRITTHKDARRICTITIDGQYTERQIAAIADEAGGLADLVAMGESDLPEGYEWSGDEVYEIVAEQTICTVDGRRVRVADIAKAVRTPEMTCCGVGMEEHVYRLTMADGSEHECIGDPMAE